VKSLGLYSLTNIPPILIFGGWYMIGGGFGGWAMIGGGD